MIFTGRSLFFLEAPEENSLPAFWPPAFTDLWLYRSTSASIITYPSDSDPFDFFFYKDHCDYTGPMWVIHDISAFQDPELNCICKAPLLCNVTESGCEDQDVKSFGGTNLPTTADKQCSLTKLYLKCLTRMFNYIVLSTPLIHCPNY